MRDTFSATACQPPVNRIRIIGVGSDYGEDRLGWHAVQALQQAGLTVGAGEAAPEFHFCPRPGNDLLALLRGAHKVIIIDAMRSGAAPGTICRFDADELDSLPAPLSSHALGLRETLQLAAALGDLPPQCIVFGIEMAHGQQSLRYQAPLQARVDWHELAKRVEQEISNHVLVNDQ